MLYLLATLALIPVAATTFGAFIILTRNQCYFTCEFTKNSKTVSPLGSFVTLCSLFIAT